jgi:diguanylate cyclase (GGDEF)-like protein
MSLARRTNIAVLKDGGSTPSSDGSHLLVHQACLDALSIPAVLLTAKKIPVPVCANAAFEAFLLDVAAAGHGTAGALFADDVIRSAFEAFLASGSGMRRFEWHEGDGIASRHYNVSFSYMDGPEGPLVLATLIDRTSAVEAERSLRAEMLRDSLTGLPNRTAFIEAVDAAIESQEGRSFAILIVDLTRFSRVNESMGSLAGDELIITVARRLVSALRVGDVLARLAGDEFGILLHLSDGLDDALQAARRIHAALLTPFRLSELEIRIDCAIGCALMSEAVTMSEDIVRNAQVALKRAKLSGRVEIYQQGEIAVARRRFSMETELRRAIEGGQLTLA